MTKNIKSKEKKNLENSNQLPNLKKQNANLYSKLQIKCKSDNPSATIVVDNVQAQTMSQSQYKPFINLNETNTKSLKSKPVTKLLEIPKNSSKVEIKNISNIREENKLSCSNMLKPELQLKGISSYNTPNISSSSKNLINRKSNEKIIDKNQLEDVNMSTSVNLRYVNKYEIVFK